MTFHRLLGAASAALLLLGTSAASAQDFLSFRLGGPPPVEVDDGHPGAFQGQVGNLLLGVDFGATALGLPLHLNDAVYGGNGGHVAVHAGLVEGSRFAVYGEIAGDSAGQCLQAERVGVGLRAFPYRWLFFEARPDIGRYTLGGAGASLSCSPSQPIEFLNQGQGAGGTSGTMPAGVDFTTFGLGLGVGVPVIHFTGIDLSAVFTVEMDTLQSQNQQTVVAPVSLSLSADWY